jgi:hypothetical protein
MSNVDAHPTNVFEWLDQIRARPSMYIASAEHPVQQVNALVHGYYSALWVHGIVEPVPAMTHHFSDWMRQQGYGFDATERGWGVAIESASRDDNSLSNFFKLVDRYRRLTPTLISTVPLHARHAPTGRCVTVRDDGRLVRPDRIDVIQYKPEPLHFLRFHYGSRLEDQHILDTRSLRAETTPEDARAWVRDEFGVAGSEWESPT